MTAQQVRADAHGLGPPAVIPVLATGKPVPQQCFVNRGTYGTPRAGLFPSRACRRKARLKEVRR